MEGSHETALIRMEIVKKCLNSKRLQIWVELGSGPPERTAGKERGGLGGGRDQNLEVYPRNLHGEEK